MLQAGNIQQAELLSTGQTAQLINSSRTCIGTLGKAT